MTRSKRSTPLRTALTSLLPMVMVASCSTLPPLTWPDRVASELELVIPAAVGDFPFPETDGQWTIQTLRIEPGCEEHRVGASRRFVIPDGVDEVSVVCQSRLLLSRSDDERSRPEAREEARRLIEDRLRPLLDELGEDLAEDAMVSHRLRLLDSPLDTEAEPGG